MQLQIIQNKIYEIRSQKVMLDFDLAALYEVETKVFNQAVKRNMQNFPEDFMFKLTKEEWTDVSNWSQIVTSSIKHRGATYTPYTFTEHGVTMLASVLKSDKARKMNIAIVRAFISLRKFVNQYQDIIEQIESLRDKLNSHDVQLDQIYTAIENMLDKKVEEDNWKERARIGFKKG